MANGHKPKIVCIDARATSLLIRKYLLEEAGHSVLTATDVESGFRLLEDHAPDLVVLDESLARQAKNLLRAKKESTGAPVLLICDMPYVNSDIRTYVDDFVWRADPVNVLLEKIRQMVDRKSGRQS